jgi:hypothetical protein
MAPLWLRRTDRNGGTPTAERKDRRRKSERRTGKDRRFGHDRRDGRRSIRDYYRSDLDRHLWSWTSPKSTRKKAPRRKKPERKLARRRTLAGVVASAAGALSAAGLSYFLYRRLKKEELPDDPAAAQADLDEADFE